MEHDQVVRRRRMVRDFSDEPIADDVLDGLIDQARRAPSAGNSQGTDFLVLSGPAQTERFWRVTLPEERRATFGWPGLLSAPALVLPCGDPQRYVDRYAEPDKRAQGLGDGVEAWSTPYWTVDTAMAAHGLLLAVVDAGLGACLFGLFDNEAGVRSLLGIPDRVVIVGVIAVGHPVESRPGRSAGRPRRPLGEVIHRNGW